MGPLKIAEVTLGCRSNAFDTASILDQVRKKKDVSIVNPSENPDFILINTCSVTDGAERDCRKAIKKLKKHNPQAQFIVTGCYAQLSPTEVADKLGVDYVVGTSMQHLIPDIIISSLGDTKGRGNLFVENIMKQCPKIYDSISSFVPHTRAFLKIQDGCNEFCTFCIIPFTRGRSRIVSHEVVIDEVNRLVDQGVKEIVLTGIHLGDYRKLVELICDISNKTKLKRLRLSSIEPFDVTNELLDCLQDTSIFMPYFHLPLQSGDDVILDKMGRPYTTRYFEKLISQITTRFPNAFIGLDVMVGFPGEDEESFEKTWKFLGSIEWSKAHVFPYSKRSGTKAAGFDDQVSPEFKKGRVSRIIGLSNERLHHFYKSHCGKTHEVLVESVKGTMAKGLTPNYIPVEFESSSVAKNQILPIFLNTPLSTRVCLGIDISSHQ
ncbi:MAG: tRNA (N(6)-L-threonylcarbamoyladenosine(37)-C(2))-methylthiotransferase MtaB [Deltaproteobacteria bacterium]|nr:tRNA (N(6)-L-threonylcarbamoyladenosine(37)-C(2))-methylthiotransferase MtaB [Deltaproteobacteria bacterium]